MTRQEFIEQYCENLKNCLLEIKDVNCWTKHIDCRFCPFEEVDCVGCAETLRKNFFAIPSQEKETIEKSIDILLKICNQYENCAHCPLKALCEYAGITIEEYTERLKKQMEVI